MKITKSQIIEIADTIKNLDAYENMQGQWVASIDDVVSSFADLLEKSNPAFKRQLFLDYINGKCGPNGEKA